MRSLIAAVIRRGEASTKWLNFAVRVLPLRAMTPPDAVEGRTSEWLTSPKVKKASAQAGVESVKAYAAAEANYERKTSKKGEPFFVLKAPNSQIIGKSEMYASAKAMENGIASVKANAPGAGVVEVTE